MRKTIYGLVLAGLFGLNTCVKNNFGLKTQALTTVTQKCDFKKCVENNFKRYDVNPYAQGLQECGSKRNDLKQLIDNQDFNDFSSYEKNVYKRTKKFVLDCKSPRFLEYDFKDLDGNYVTLNLFGCKKDLGPAFAVIARSYKKKCLVSPLHDEKDQRVQSSYIASEEGLRVCYLMIMGKNIWKK